MMNRVGNRYLIRMQGYSDVSNKLWFDPDVSSCGDIENGVALGLGDDAGMFVISYDDLIAMAEKAKEQRDKDQGRHD